MDLSFISRFDLGFDVYEMKRPHGFSRLAPSSVNEVWSLDQNKTNGVFVFAEAIYLVMPNG